MRAHHTMAAGLTVLAVTATLAAAEAAGTKVGSSVVQNPCDDGNLAQQWRLTIDPAAHVPGDDLSAPHRGNAGYLIRPLTAPDLAMALDRPGNDTYTDIVLNRAVASTDRLFRFLIPGQS